MSESEREIVDRLSARFNEFVDDEESFEIICRRGTNEVTLAKPSLALYHGDRELYEQEIQQFKRTQEAEVLNLDSYPRNESVFADVRHATRRGTVIPFVGAGLSVDAGCPAWSAYVVDRVREAGLDVEDAERRLKDGEHELVMEEVIEKLGTRFERNFQQDFNSIDVFGCSAGRLPDIFDGCAITTNFDRVVEESYLRQGKGFAEKVIGTRDTGTFLKAIPSGQRYLLKLHGNLDNAASRVLTQSEYDLAYGNDSIDFSRELPQVLRRLYCGYSLFFLGCSLANDRTMKTFLEVVNTEGKDRIPDHYAIIESPEDDANRDELDDLLARCCIHPIWFPNAEYRYVDQILELMQL